MEIFASKVANTITSERGTAATLGPRFLGADVHLGLSGLGLTVIYRLCKRADLSKEEFRKGQG